MDVSTTAAAYVPEVDLERKEALVVHEPRPLPAKLIASFVRAARDEAFDTRAELTGTDPVGSLPLTLSEGPARERLEADLRLLVPRFLQATGNDTVFARLKVIDQDECRRFHRDFIRLRAIVTYAGPGTEWLTEDNVRRACLDETGDADAINERTVKDWGRVCRAAPGDFLWLKGAESGEGAVHRSPPLHDSGIRRVVLKLDDRTIRRT